MHRPRPHRSDMVSFQKQSEGARRMSKFDRHQKQLVVAMDHARAMGAVEGLEDPGAVIDMAIEAGADAIMTSYGVIKRYKDRLIGQIPTLLRVDGGPSFYREDWLKNTAWRTAPHRRGRRSAWRRWCLHHGLHGLRGRDGDARNHLRGRGRTVRQLDVPDGRSPPLPMRIGSRIRWTPKRWRMPAGSRSSMARMC